MHLTQEGDNMLLSKAVGRCKLSLSVPGSVQSLAQQPPPGSTWDTLQMSLQQGAAPPATRASDELEISASALLNPHWFCIASTSSAPRQSGTSSTQPGKGWAVAGHPCAPNPCSRVSCCFHTLWHRLSFKNTFCKVLACSL